MASTFEDASIALGVVAGRSDAPLEVVRGGSFTAVITAGVGACPVTISTSCAVADFFSPVASDVACSTLVGLRSRVLAMRSAFKAGSVALGVAAGRSDALLKIVRGGSLTAAGAAVADKGGADLSALAVGGFVITAGTTEIGVCRAATGDDANEDSPGGSFTAAGAAGSGACPDD
jgi:hypothetical protein